MFKRLLLAAMFALSAPLAADASDSVHLVETAQAVHAEPPIIRLCWIFITWALIMALGFVSTKLWKWLTSSPVSGESGPSHGRGPKDRILVDLAAAVQDSPPDGPVVMSTAHIRLQIEGTAPNWGLSINRNEYDLWPNDFSWTTFETITGQMYCHPMDFPVATFELRKRIGDLNNFDLTIRMVDGRTIEAHLDPAN